MVFYLSIFVLFSSTNLTTFKNEDASKIMLG